MQAAWQPIATAPDGENDRVLVYHPVYGVCEARASKDGGYCDPRYGEWFEKGATHWAPLPEFKEMTWKYGRQTPDNNLMRFVARRFHGGHCLDIGSGEGANARELVARGFSVMRIDSDPATEALHVDIREADKIGAPFDLIYDVNTLCHVENPPFERIKSWLKPDGIFFTVWPAKGTWPGVAEGKDYTKLVVAPELRGMLDMFSTVQVWCGRAPRFVLSPHSYLDSWIAEARP